MNTDRLADMRERASWVLDVCDPYTALYPAETAGALARDVLALVEITKAARELVSILDSPVAVVSGRVIDARETARDALARLDSGAAEEQA